MLERSLNLWGAFKGWVCWTNTRKHTHTRATASQACVGVLLESASAVLSLLLYSFTAVHNTLMDKHTHTHTAAISARPFSVSQEHILQPYRTSSSPQTPRRASGCWVRGSFTASMFEDTLLSWCVRVCVCFQSGALLLLTLLSAPVECISYQGGEGCVCMWVYVCVCVCISWGG